MNQEKFNKHSTQTGALVDGKLTKVEMPKDWQEEFGQEFDDELGFIWKDYFDFNYKQCACSQEESNQRADEVIKEIKTFISNLIDQSLKDQRNELTDKLLTAFNLTVKDLPAFPKDLDVIELIVLIGIERIRREREELERFNKDFALSDATSKLQ